MTHIKILSGVVLVSVFLSILIIHSKEHREDFPVRSFTRNYFEIVPSAATRIANVKTKQIKYCDNDLFASTQTESDFSVFSLLHPTRNGDSEPAGLIINWNVRNNRLYAADVRQGRIIEKNYDNDEVLVRPLSRRFTRIIQINDSISLMKGRDSSNLNDVFCRVNILEDSYEEIGSLLGKYDDGGFATDGFFISDNDGKFYHISYYTADLLAFDRDARPVFKSATIDKVRGLPHTIVSRNGNRYMSSQTPVIHKAAAANSEMLFIVSTVNSQADGDVGAQASIIDIYRAHDAAYLGSIRPQANNKPITSIACSRSELFYLSGSAVFKIPIRSMQPKANKQALAFAVPEIKNQTLN